MHAHFRGHAYDPHDHDEALVGVTLQGVQEFRCRRAVHQSTAGRVMLVEPGAVHDGRAPEAVGFTYAMLYLPQPWLATAGTRLGSPAVAGVGAAFRHTVAADDALCHTIHHAFVALHAGEAALWRSAWAWQAWAQAVEPGDRGRRPLAFAEPGGDHSRLRARRARKSRPYMRASPSVEAGAASPLGSIEVPTTL